MSGEKTRSERRSEASSSGPDHMPAARPASAAAPKAVVSTFAGRSTGMPSMSAWNCIMKSLTLAPPSTRSSVMGFPRSRSMVRTRSVTS